MTISLSADERCVTLIANSCRRMGFAMLRTRMNSCFINSGLSLVIINTTIRMSLHMTSRHNQTI